MRGIGNGHVIEAGDGGARGERGAVTQKKRLRHRVGNNPWLEEPRQTVSIETNDEYPRGRHRGPADRIGRDAGSLKLVDLGERLLIQALQVRIVNLSEQRAIT